MITEELLETAIRIAKIGHCGQKDKAGKPYVEHPLRVMEKLDTTTEKIVAVLHDIVEDTDITLTELEYQGFPPVIISAIAALTKLPQENYQDYLKRVMSNAIALKVKIADMEDNMDLNRISNPTTKDYERLAKYNEIHPRLVAEYKKVIQVSQG